MSDTYMTLREAGIPYPDMTSLNAMSEKLGHKALFNGSYLRNLVVLGHYGQAYDIDAIMHHEDFLALKPKESGQEDVRKHFHLHDQHHLFMVHIIVDGKFADLGSPLVWDLKPEFQHLWPCERPLGLNTTTKWFTVEDRLFNTDLGITQIVSDGTEIWVSPAFITDMKNKTLTLTRCRDARDFARTQYRVNRFTQSRGDLEGWPFVIPEDIQIPTD